MPGRSDFKGEKPARTDVNGNKLREFGLGRDGSPKCPPRRSENRLLKRGGALPARGGVYKTGYAQSGAESTPHLIRTPSCRQSRMT